MISGERKRLDSQRSRAAQFFCKNYSREERYLIILQRDLEKEFEAINSLGIEKAKSFQIYFDFLLNFENLREKMKEFKWSKDFLKENGIDFVSLKKLYFSLD